MKQFKEPFPCDLSFLYHSLLNRGKGIRRGGKGNSVDIQIQDIHAAVGAVESPFHRAVHKQVQHNFRHSLLHHLVMSVIALLDTIHHNSQMGAEKLPQTLRRIFPLRFQILQRIVQCHSHVDSGHILKRIFPSGNGNPVAAAFHTHPAQLQGKPVFRKTFTDSLFQGIADAAAVLQRILHGSFQKDFRFFRLSRHRRMDSDGQIGGNLQKVHGIQDNKGKPACHLPVSRRGESPYLGIVCIIKKQAGDHPYGLFLRQNPFCRIPFKIFLQQGIQRPQRASSAISPVHRLEMGEELNGLTECLRSPETQRFVHRRYRLIIFLPEGIRFFPGQLFSQQLMCLHPFQNSQHQLFLAFVKIRIRRVVSLPVIPYFIQKPLPAQPQANFRVGAQMIHAAEACLRNSVFADGLLKLRRSVFLRQPQRHEPIQGTHPAAGQRAASVDIFGHLIEKPAEVFPYQRTAVHQTILTHLRFKMEFREVDKSVIIDINRTEPPDFSVINLHLILMQLSD